MKREKWTKEEEKIMRKFYENTSTHDLIEKYLPNRRKTQIYAKANKMGLKHSRELRNKAISYTANSKIPLGTRIKTQNGYWRVKTKKGWEYEHRLKFEKAYGIKLKSNQILSCKNNDLENTDPRNWELSTRAGVLSKNADFHKSAKTLKKRKEWQRLKEDYAFKF